MLIIVVVLSMALTPGLAELGKVVGDWLDSLAPPTAAPQLMVADSSSIDEHSLESPIVICGFGPQSQLLVNMLENPLVPERPPYVVFDLDPIRVQNARGSGFPVIFGDGSRQVVLQAAGVKRPRCFVVCHRNSEQVRGPGGVGRGSMKVDAYEMDAAEWEASEGSRYTPAGCSLFATCSATRVAL